MIHNMKTMVTRMIVTIVRKPSRKGAKAMLGYASTFRKPRTTAEWMAELRDGEKA